MKVVVNRCCGGFGISIEALYELIKMHSDLVMKYPRKEYYGEDGMADYDRQQIVNYKDGFKQHKLVEYLLDGEYVYHLKSECEYGEYDWSMRSHLDLIDVVTKLGKKVNGHCANLQIVEIPDDVKWVVEEYDGSEWVAEAHRTW